MRVNFIFLIFVLCSPLIAFSEKTPIPTPTPINFGPSLFGSQSSNAPTFINADSLTLKSEERFFIYTGHVVVTQEEMTMTSKTLEGTYTPENKIERLIARGDVVITKPELKATGQKAIYEAATDIMTLYDNPQVTQNDSILTADKIIVHLKDNRSEAVGTVRVTLVKKDTPKPTATPAGTGTPKAAAAPNNSPIPTAIPSALPTK